METLRLDNAWSRVLRIQIIVIDARAKNYNIVHFLLQ
jgi:hypothetical protein